MSEDRQPPKTQLISALLQMQECFETQAERNVITAAIDAIEREAELREALKETLKLAEKCHDLLDTYLQDEVGNGAEVLDKNAEVLRKRASRAALSRTGGKS